ncbi:helix-turn-helix domain-containing protein [Saccharopolyspora hattusasensis]|uniref:helix-turn-helix domain-containing protein n=1 Tax=Saccharopolyspora hattusasensis TaxID=1128679 RepID=UPI003D95F362
MHADDVGRRIREIRSWRRLNLRAAAELSGLSHGYLGQIERGEKPIKNRHVLEAIANTLRVSPGELIGKPYAPIDPVSEEIRAGVPAIEDALTGWWLGDAPGTPLRPWQQVRADAHHLNTVLRPNADFARQVEVLPDLIRDLLAEATRGGENRAAALRGLIGAYKSAAYLAHDLGLMGLPALAAERMRQSAAELDDPTWTTYAEYQRAQLISGRNRPRQYQLAVEVADMPGGRVETRGMAHLTAALAKAAQGDADTAQMHLTEARELAELIEADVSPWMQTNFGRTNVGIWRVSIGLELGDGGKAMEIAQTVHPEGVSQSRRAAYWIDYGRALLAERNTRHQGVAALLRAETLAPQKVRTNVFVREAVSGPLASAPRDAWGRDLRGLAWRLGLAPTG